MRLLSRIFRPEYLFALSIISFFGFSALWVLTFREKIRYYSLLSWSPDGTKLAFRAEEDADYPEIFVIDADGRNPVKLTPSRLDRTDVDFQWSADSETLYLSITPHTGHNPQSWVTTWYRASISPNKFNFSLFGQRGTAPQEYPLATQEEIDSSIETGSASDTYYARSVCNDPRYGNRNISHCEKTLEVYSIETDELVWSFGKQRYNRVRYGIFGLGDTSVYSIGLVKISPFLFGLSILVAILRRFRKPDNRKSKEKHKN